MARFPYYQNNIRKLGEVLAKARTDSAFRQRLIDNPKSELEAVGLPECVHQLMTFEVIDGAKERATALPYRLNQDRLDRKDPSYLGKIAQTFTAIN